MGPDFLVSPRKSAKKATEGGAEAVPILDFYLVSALPGTEAALPQPPPGPLRETVISHLSIFMLFGIFLFDLLLAGRFCANDHFLNLFVLNMRGLHNIIMVNQKNMITVQKEWLLTTV